MCLFFLINESSFAASMFSGTEDSLKVNKIRNTIFKGTTVCFEEAKGSEMVNFDSLDNSSHFAVFGTVPINLLVPIRCQFRYSDYNYYSQKNYFNISLDQSLLNSLKSKVESYKSDSLNSKLDSLKSQLSYLDKKKTFLSEKGQFYYSEISKYNNSSNSFIDSINYLEKYNNNDLVENKLKDKSDSLKQTNFDLREKVNVVDSFQFKQSSLSDNSNLNQYTKTVNQSNLDSLKDSVSSLNINQSSFKDSLLKVNSQLESIIIKGDSLIHLINETQREIRQFAIDSNYVKNKSDKFYRKICMSITKLNLGLFCPEYSTFLLNGLQIMGGQIEFEYKWLFSVLYGKTINDSFNTNLNVSNNSTNIFDDYLSVFKRSETSKNILSFKTGPGKKSMSHTYLGFLYGYYSKSTYAGTIGPAQNIVLEGDWQYVVTPNFVISMLVDKSFSFWKKDSFFKNQDDLNGKQFTNNNFNTAYSLSIKKSFKPFKTKFNFEIKYVEPAFSSLGSPYLLSDFVRYQIGSSHTINQRLKLQLRLKHQTNNLHGLLGYRSEIRSYLARTIYRVNKRMSVSLIVNSISNVTNLKEYGSIQSNYNSDILVLSYMPRSKRITQYFEGSFSHFSYKSSIENSRINNISISDFITFNKIISAGVSFSGNYCEPKINETYLLSTTESIMFKPTPKVSIDIKMLSEYFESNKIHCSPSLTVQYQIAQNISFLVSYENVFNNVNINESNLNSYHTLRGDLFKCALQYHI